MISVLVRARICRSRGTGLRRTSMALGLAAEWLDLVWTVLVLAGAEHIDIGRDGAVSLSFMAYCHGLVATLVWSAGRLLVMRHSGYSWLIASSLAAAVLFRWVLDWLSHSGELPLAVGRGTMGIRFLSSNPYTASLVETALAATSATAFALRAAHQGRSVLRVLSVVVVMFFTILFAVLAPQPTSAASIAWTALASIAFMIGIGTWADAVNTRGP